MNLTAILDELNLPLNLKVDGFFYVAERVEVFYLAARAKLFLPSRPYRNISIATKRAPKQNKSTMGGPVSEKGSKK